MRNTKDLCSVAAKTRTWSNVERARAKKDFTTAAAAGWLLALVYSSPRRTRAAFSYACVCVSHAVRENHERVRYKCVQMYKCADMCVCVCVYVFTLACTINVYCMLHRIAWISAYNQPVVRGRVVKHEAYIYYTLYRKFVVACVYVMWICAGVRFNTAHSILRHECSSVSKPNSTMITYTKHIFTKQSIQKSRKTQNTIRDNSRTDNIHSVSHIH